MYEIRLLCTDIDPAVGEAAAADIQTEFRDHRPWHYEVRCQFDDRNLILTAKNDYDAEGLALLDEFSDCLSAYLIKHGDLRVVSVTPV